MRFPRFCRLRPAADRVGPCPQGVPGDLNSNHEALIDCLHEVKQEQIGSITVNPGSPHAPGVAIRDVFAAVAVPVVAVKKAG